MLKRSTRNMRIRLKKRLLSLRPNSLDSRMRTSSLDRSLNPIARRYQRRLLSLTPSKHSSRSMNMISKLKSNNWSKRPSSFRTMMSALHVPKILVRNLETKRSKLLQRRPRISIAHYKMSIQTRLKWNQIWRSHFKFKRSLEPHSKAWCLIIKRYHGLTPHLTISEQISRKLNREEQILERRLMNSMFSPLKRIRSWNENLRLQSSATIMK